MLVCKNEVKVILKLMASSHFSNSVHTNDETQLNSWVELVELRSCIDVVSVNRSLWFYFSGLLSEFHRTDVDY